MRVCGYIIAFRWDTIRLARYTWFWNKDTIGRPYIASAVIEHNGPEPLCHIYMIGVATKCTLLLQCVTIPETVMSHVYDRSSYEAYTTCYNMLQSLKPLCHMYMIGAAIKYTPPVTMCYNP